MIAQPASAHKRFGSAECCYFESVQFPKRPQEASIGTGASRLRVIELHKQILFDLDISPPSPVLHFSLLQEQS